MFGTQLGDTTGPGVSDGSHTPRAPWGGAGGCPSPRSAAGRKCASHGPAGGPAAQGRRQSPSLWRQVGEDRAAPLLPSWGERKGRASGLSDTHSTWLFSGPQRFKIASYCFCRRLRRVYPNKSTRSGTERSLVPKLLSPGRPLHCWPRSSSSSLPGGRGASAWSLWVADRQPGALGHRSEEQQIKGSRRRLQTRPAPPATCRASLSQKLAGSSASQLHQARPSSTELWPPCPHVLTATTSSKALLASGPSNTCCAGPLGRQARPCRVPLLPGLQGSTIAREGPLSSG